ncbi:universal stress protein [Oryzomonas japonica]|uniref:Universal stress protein n=1 Tax=Oryzomonas japonica TaxID=2603858 RepID=A0A7J4ZMS3_9BACT|nr:universal stress protein [Oryzomonas japonica]KAB0664057.1 universal stress protein [Oryzomonas japonica]
MKRFDKIMMATDFSDNSDYAFDYALALARQFDAELTIVHVINEPADLRGIYVPEITYEELEKEINQGAKDMMAKFCKNKLADYGNYKTVIASGVPFQEIIAKADETGAALIVIGTHGRTGLEHLVFGSTAERVVRAAHCPVLSVRLPVK